MSLSVFASLPDQTRLWVYPFTQPLMASQIDQLSQAFDAFVSQWQRHGEAVRGAWTLIDGRLLVLCAADEVSGCSIDSSVRVLKALRDEQGIDGLDRALVLFREEESITAMTRIDFQDKIKSGDVTAETIVFDTTIQTLGDLRAGKLDVPLSEAWHAKAFKLN